VPEPQQPPEVLLKPDVAQALLDYLGQRPYVEVAALIAAILEGRQNGTPKGD
jgi:hypothetical protein